MSDDAAAVLILFCIVAGRFLEFLRDTAPINEPAREDEP